MRVVSSRPFRAALAGALVAWLAACQTVPREGPPSGLPGNVTRIPPGNADRDGPEASPPPNLEAVPDAVPQIEPLRIGGPNKPYEIGGQTYVPITDDRSITETGFASWYGKKFHGRRTASGEAYNMYAMTAAHKTLPIPSYARVRNPANGHEVIVRVNDRGPFSAGRVIDLSYTAALKLGVLGGVQKVEISRITADDIRSGAALARGAKTVVASTVPAAPAVLIVPVIPAVVPAPVATGDVIAKAPGSAAPVDLGAAAAADAASAPTGVVTTEIVATSVAVVPPAANPDRRDERGHAETAAGAGFWVQIGAYRERDGALDFQHRLIDELPWLAPLLAVFSDHDLNKLQAGPYASRREARAAAERVRAATQLVPTIIDKR